MIHVGGVFVFPAHVMPMNSALVVGLFVVAGTAYFLWGGVAGPVPVGADAVGPPPRQSDGATTNADVPAPSVDDTVRIVGAALPAPPAIDAAAAPAAGAESLRRTAMGSVGLPQLIQALRESSANLRQECHEEEYAANVARIPADLDEERKRKALDTARTIAEREFDMKTVRNRILEDRYVYSIVPAEKPTWPGKVRMAQFGTLKVGDSLAEFKIHTEDYPEFEQAMKAWMSARADFREILGR